MWTPLKKEEEIDIDAVQNEIEKLETELSNVQTEMSKLLQGIDR